MDVKTNKQVYSLAPAIKYLKRDEESATSPSSGPRRKKWIKWAAYITIAVLQAIVILVLALTVMRDKTPMVRLGTDVTFQSINPGSQTVEMSFTTQVHVKNINFGPYKYDK